MMTEEYLTVKQSPEVVGTQYQKYKENLKNLIIETS